jgi:pilus assembly protein CpaB
VVGRIPRERILANEFVRSDRLADPVAGVGLNAIIPRGMRAISINIADGQALSGFLNPGNYVDLLVTVQPDVVGEAARSTAKPETNTLLQAVFVLGVNSRMRNESRDDAKARGRNRPSVTLLTTADQAEQVAHAENMGEVTLTLRNDLDVTYADLSGVDIDDLRSVVQKAAPKAVRKVQKTVKKCREFKIVSGADSRTILVDENGVPCD